MAPAGEPDTGPRLRAICIATIIIPTVAVILRFWSRALLPRDPTPMSKVKSRFWWDDWTILAALILTIACQVCTIRMVELGVGKHANIVSVENQSEILKYLWINEFMFNAGITLAKSSALFFYIRVFNNAEKTFRRVIWGVQAAAYLWLLGILITVTFLCIPVNKRNFVVPFSWFSFEIPISAVCVSLPSIFFFVRRAYREGPRALVSRQVTRSKIDDSPHRYGPESKNPREKELSAHSAEPLGQSWLVPEPQDYAANASAVSPDDSSLELGRIHVQNEVEVDHSFMR
ncbi:MAG: hypothetical protein M1820_000745 [Bogoriella megaspora]|nr:MAG: hypothetical protein M1820_000745 [Bogoriella megaspora]